MLYIFLMILDKLCVKKIILVQDYIFSLYKNKIPILTKNSQYPLEGIFINSQFHKPKKLFICNGLNEINNHERKYLFWNLLDPYSNVFGNKSVWKS